MMNKKYILILLTLSFLFSQDNEYKKTSFSYSDNKWYIGSAYSNLTSKYFSQPVIIGNAQKGLELSLTFDYDNELDKDEYDIYLSPAAGFDGQQRLIIKHKI